MAIPTTTDGVGECNQLSEEFKFNGSMVRWQLPWIHHRCTRSIIRLHYQPFQRHSWMQCVRTGYWMLHVLSSYINYRRALSTGKNFPNFVLLEHFVKYMFTHTQMQRATFLMNMFSMCENGKCALYFWDFPIIKNTLLAIIQYSRWSV